MDGKSGRNLEGREVFACVARPLDMACWVLKEPHVMDTLEEFKNQKERAHTPFV